MRVRNAPGILFVCLVGCTPAPVVTKGTFTTAYTLTMQCGSPVRAGAAGASRVPDRAVKPGRTLACT
jgi:hypothetical protein